MPVIGRKIQWEKPWELASNEGELCEWTIIKETDEGFEIELETDKVIFTEEASVRDVLKYNPKFYKTWDETAQSIIDKF